MVGHKRTIRSPGYRLSQAICDCGWVGPVRDSQRMAAYDYSDHKKEMRHTPRQVIAVVNRYDVKARRDQMVMGEYDSLEKATAAAYELARDIMDVAGEDMDGEEVIVHVGTWRDLERPVL